MLASGINRILVVLLVERSFERASHCRYNEVPSVFFIVLDDGKEREALFLFNCCYSS
jgi:hypothetical protein